MPRRAASPSRLLQVHLAFAVLTAIAGCSCDGGGPSDATGAAADVRPASVSIAIEGRPAATVEVGPADARLEDLVPEGTPPPSAWFEVHASGPENRWLALPRFGEKAEREHLVLRATATGARLELRRDVRPGLPDQVRLAASRPLAHLDGVTAVTIRLSDPRAARPERELHPIVVVVDGEEVRLAPPRLAELAEVEGAEGRKRGWSLGELLSLATRGRAAARVRLANDAGEERSLTAEELAAGDVFLVRFNREGDLRYERFPPGERRSSDGLRAVTTLEVQTAPGSTPTSPAPTSPSPTPSARPTPPRQ